MELTGKLNSVLLLEADQATNNLITFYLGKFGSDIESIEHWDTKAIETVRAGRFDLAIIDWRSKIQSAYDVYRMLRSLPAMVHTPVIFISGQITKQDLEKTAKDPLTKFVLKPFSEDVLVKNIRELMRRQIEVKDKAAKEVRVIRGDGPNMLDPSRILKSQTNVTSGFHQKGSNGPKASLVTEKLGKGADLLLSDLDADENEEMSDLPPAPSSVFTPKPKEEIATFDYRLIQKISSHGKARHELPLDILVLDDDHMITNLVSNHRVETNTDKDDVFTNGIDAWQAIIRHNYGLIIMDWRCKGMSGLCLYNRIRSRAETRKTPVLILTGGGLQRENFKIIEDRKITMVLEKPFELEVFAKAMETLRSQEMNDLEIIELAVKTIDGAAGDRKKMLSDLILVSVRVSSKFDFFLAAGQYLIHLGDNLMALKLLEAASKIDSENVTLMTELAKVYLRLNRPTDSLKLLNLANKFSPGNIQRLCLMGEAGLDLSDTEKARSYFNEALEIDSENLRAQRGATLAKNISEYTAQQGIKPLKEQFASTLNLIGVTLIKNGQLQEGIEQYHCAMAFIHDGPTLARLQFNLGLAYHRQGNKSLAIEWLEESCKSAGGEFPKALQWIQRIRHELSKKPKKAGPEVSAINWESPELIDSLADSLQKLTEDDAI